MSADRIIFHLWLGQPPPTLRNTFLKASHVGTIFLWRDVFIFIIITFSPARKHPSLWSNPQLFT